MVQEQLRQADSDLEATQGSNASRYKELKERETFIKGVCVQLAVCECLLCVCV